MVIITGEYLKTLRKKLGLTQQALAARVGLTQAHIARIEAQKVNPTLATINKILASLQPKEVKKCRDIMSKRLFFVSPGEKIGKAVDIMRKHGVSQLPVMQHGTQIGSMSETTVLRNFGGNAQKLIKDVMDKPFPILDAEESVDAVLGLLEFHQAVLVAERGKIAGIITRADLLKSKTF